MSTSITITGIPNRVRRETLAANLYELYRINVDAATITLQPSNAPNEQTAIVRVANEHEVRKALVAINSDPFARSVFARRTNVAGFSPQAQLSITAKRLKDSNMQENLEEFLRDRTGRTPTLTVTKATALAAVPHTSGKSMIVTCGDVETFAEIWALDGVLIKTLCSATPLRVARVGGPLATTNEDLTATSSNTPRVKNEPDDDPAAPSGSAIKAPRMKNEPNDNPAAPSGSTLRAHQEEDEPSEHDEMVEASRAAASTKAPKAGDGEAPKPKRPRKK